MVFDFTNIVVYTQTKISVLIPVYNTEKYLRECVDSTISQTYSQLEIILVDDGSADNSGKICDEYAQNDKRVKVIHKPNGGLSSARNVGIDKATGEYIAFVDSDDYLKKDYVEKLLETIKKLQREENGKSFANFFLDLSC